MRKNKLKGVLLAACCSIIISSSEVQCMDRDESRDTASKSKKIVANTGKTGAEAWKDQLGNPAPAIVRRAADNLWSAVEIEGAAAASNGWVRKKQAHFVDYVPYYVAVRVVLESVCQ